MNELKIFQNAEFGNVRTMEDNGKVMFCGKDVAEALGFQDTVKAMKHHCKDPGVAFYPLGVRTGTKKDGTPAIQNTKVKFIDEGNVYRLITHSRLPGAERFEHWVFDEVLPQIRKNGGYGDINQIVQKCVCEVMERIMPAISGQCHRTENLPDFLTEAALVRGGRQRRFKLNELPTDIFCEVIKGRVLSGMRYEEISDMLTARGYNISHGAVWRFFRAARVIKTYPDRIELLMVNDEVITVFLSGEVRRVICG